MKKVLNYVVATINNKERLCKVEGGYCASDAWLETGSFDDIAGDKFGILDGADGKEGWVPKYNIRPIKDKTELDTLYAETCEAFKVRDYIEVNVMPKLNFKGYWKAMTTLGSIPGVLNKGFTSEEVIEYFKNLGE